MPENTYFIALIKGTGKVRCWANGHRRDTVIVQLRRSIDYLSCDAWRFIGERITTKQAIVEKRTQLLAAINREHGTHFTHIIID